MIMKIVQVCNIASVLINHLYGRVNIIVQIVEME